MLGNTTKSLRPETTEQSSLQGFPLLLHVLKGHTRLSEVYAHAYSFTPEPPSAFDQNFFLILLKCSDSRFQLPMS